MKLSYLKKFSDIFLIKLGKIIEDSQTSNCYQVPSVISSFFKIYYYGAINFFIFVFIFLMLPNIADSLLITIAVALIIYILFELLLFVLIPLNKIECWKKNL